MKKQVGMLLMATVAVGSFLAGRPQTGDANSAPPYWMGSEGAGAILAGDECPIEVKHETLTLSVPRLSVRDGFGSVTAEYELYNPTADDLTTQIVFPMGVRPDYVGIDEVTDGAYSVTADGAPVDCTLRYTRNDNWGGAGNSFDIDEGIRRLYPEEHPFYADDTPVYVHTVEATASYRPEGRAGDWVTLAIEFDGSVKKTRVFGGESCSFFPHDGKGQIVKSYDNEEGMTQIFTFYAVGEDVTIDAMKIYRYRGGTKAVDEEAHFSERPYGGEQLTFKEFTEDLCKKSGGETFEEDWREGFISLLEESRIEGTCMCPIDLYALKKSSFLCWYEYSLTVPAGETVNNTVTAPLYPTVDRSSPQTLYEYAYLLSPASKWADFGGIDIEIETPFYLSDSTLGFTKTENSYIFSRGNLPMGELRFVLTEEERIRSEFAFPNGEDPNGTLITAIVLLCVAAVAIAVVVTVIVVSTKKRRKAREEEERRLLMGRMEQGAVDLPPDDRNKPTPPRGE